MTPAHPQAFPLTFGTLLRESARRYPDKAAVVGYRGDTRLALSYGALDRAANRLANALLREGYAKSASKSATKSEAAPGRWLAILSPNDVDYPAVHFGAARAGSPLAHVSVRANAAGRAEMLARVGAELLFVHAAFADEARALLAASATLKRVVAIGGAEGPDSLDAFTAGAPETDPPVAVAPDDPAAVTFSSGSTGEPKGVLVSHRNRALASCLGAQAFELAGDDVMGCTTPLFHVAGLFMWLQIGIRRGLTVVLLEKWAPDLFADAVARDGVTAAFLVPAQVTALLNDLAAAGRICRAGGGEGSGGGGKGGGLRHLNISGAPIPSGLLDRALDAWPGLEIVEHYGQSESCPLAYRPAAFARSKPMSAGRPCVEMAVLDGRWKDPARRAKPARSPAAAATRCSAISATRKACAASGPATAGSGPAISAGSTRTASSTWSTGPGTSSSPAARTSSRPRSSARSTATPRCANAPCSACPTTRWGEVPAAHVVANGAGVAPMAATRRTNPP